MYLNDQQENFILYLAANVRNFKVEREQLLRELGITPAQYKSVLSALWRLRGYAFGIAQDGAVLHPLPGAVELARQIEARRASALKPGLAGRFNAWAGRNRPLAAVITIAVVVALAAGALAAALWLLGYFGP